MIDGLPLYINLVFIGTIFIGVFLFYKAARGSKLTLVLVLSWLVLQAFLGASGFYKVVDTFPPRFMLLGVPPLMLIIVMFSTTKGREFIELLDIKYLTYLHTLRVPIEIVLFWLFLHKQVPQIMTFEGRNLDILAGLTAPIVAYLVFGKMKLNKNVLLVWNIASLCLLINIVFIAFLSAETPLQQFGFEQPNNAVLHFPFAWLPSCLVPIVLFSHLATIKRLLRRGSSALS